MPLLVHGEVTDPQVDVFDREALFIERVHAAPAAAYPALKVVFEHIDQGRCGIRARCGRPRGGDHHAPASADNRNALFQGGMRPHMYCLPILKRTRQALVAAATSGSKRFSWARTAPRTHGA